MDTKQKSRLGLAKAIEYYTKEGYTVCVPLNDTQWYDLVVQKGNEKFESVQVKACGCESRFVDFRCIGHTGVGGSRKICDRVCDHPVDHVFCVDLIDDMLYDIPGDVVRKNNLQGVALLKEKSRNGQGINSFQYVVK